MITVYDVQTFYGTRQKTFQHAYNAGKYYDELCREYDPGLVEVTKRRLTTEEFCYEDLED